MSIFRTAAGTYVIQTVGPGSTGAVPNTANFVSGGSGGFFGRVPFPAPPTFPTRPFTFQAEAPPVRNLVVPIDMVDYAPSSSAAGAVEFQRTQRSLDTSKFDGSPTYVWEIVAVNADPTDRDVELLDSTGTVKATITVPASTSAFTRFETSWTPNAGADIYNLRVAQTTSGAAVKVPTSRIVVTQTGATKTGIFVPLIAKSGSDNGDVYVEQSSSTTYTQGIPDYYSLWRRVAADFDALAPTNPLKLEAVIGVSNAGATGSAALFNATDSTQVTGAEVTHTGDTVPTLKTVSFDSTAVNFDDGDAFEVRIKTSANAVRIYNAGLWIYLEGLNKGEVYWRVLRLGEEAIADNSARGDHFRAKVPISSYSGGVAYFDVTGRESTLGTVTVDLYDGGTGDSGTTGSTVSGSVIAFDSTTRARTRSGALTLTHDNRHFGHHDWTSGTLVWTSGWLVVAFSEPLALEEKAGSATLAGGGDASVSGTKGVATASVLASGAALGSTGSGDRAGATTGTGGGAVTVQGVHGALGTTVVSAGGVLSSQGVHGGLGTTTVSGGASLGSQGVHGGTAASQLASGGAGTAAGTPAKAGAGTLGAGGAGEGAGAGARAGTATLETGGAIVVAGGRAVDGSAVLEGGGELAGQGAKGASHSAMLEGSGAISVDGLSARSATAVLEAGGYATSTAVLAPSGSAILWGGGEGTSGGFKSALGSALLSSGGSLAATGVAGVAVVGDIPPPPLYASVVNKPYIIRGI